MADEVLLDVNERVATITLNRPDKMNTINSALGSQLIEALVEVRNNDDIRIATTGASLGAFYAANFALKYAETFHYALCLSGRYNTTHFTDGFTNSDI